MAPDYAIRANDGLNYRFFDGILIQFHVSIYSKYCSTWMPGFFRKDFRLDSLGGCPDTLFEWSGIIENKYVCLLSASAERFLDRKQFIVRFPLFLGAHNLSELRRLKLDPKRRQFN